jgi:hypothetical protein
MAKPRRARVTAQERLAVRDRSKGGRVLSGHSRQPREDSGSDPGSVALPSSYCKAKEVTSSRLPLEFVLVVGLGFLLSLVFLLSA